MPDAVCTGLPCFGNYASLKLNEGCFFCFGCGAKGDVIDLVVKLFDLSSYETEEELAKKIIKEVLRVMKPDGELVVTEWERSDNFIKKIFPIEILEPKPYKSFVTKDHKNTLWNLDWSM